MSCHCNNTNCQDCNGGNDEYLLVKATSSSSCAEPGDGSNSCPKQEPTYDSTLTGFLVPSLGESVTFQVCNIAIYSVGQWVYFTTAGVYLRIIAINDSFITVASGCANGNEVDNQPGYNQTIPIGSQFLVTGKPDCSDPVDIDVILDDAEQICVDSLIESNPEAEMQIIGRVEADVSDINFGRCLKRIKDFLWKDNGPVWPSIKLVPKAGLIDYSNLGINAAGEVAELEKVTLDASANYVATERRINLVSRMELFKIGDNMVGKETSFASGVVSTSIAWPAEIAAIIDQFSHISSQKFAELDVEYAMESTVAGNKSIQLRVASTSTNIADEDLRAVGKLSGRCSILIPCNPLVNFTITRTLLNTETNTSVYIGVYLRALYV